MEILIITFANTVISIWGVHNALVTYRVGDTLREGVNSARRRMCCTTINSSTYGRTYIFD